MNRFRTAWLLGAIAFSAAWCGVGCRAVPVSDRYQLLLTGSDYENTVGAEAYAEYKKKLKVSGDKKYTAALDRVGPALKAVAPANDFQWEFLVFEDSTANAFCLPGGKVGVYSGLFRYVANDAELACVVAHEIAHAIARHSGERMSWDALRSLGATAVEATIDDPWVASAYGVGTQFGVMLPFSRANESEADYIGLIMMAQAGYDPHAAITFWKKFGDTGTGSKIAGWLSTHPGGADRIADLEKDLPKAEACYRKVARPRGLGVKLQ